MLNYLPEHIYEILKDEPKFLDINNIAENKFKNCKSLKDFNSIVSADNKEQILPKELYELVDLINEKCPQYLLDFKMMCGFYTKEELLLILNNEIHNNSDNEIKAIQELICYAQLSNASHVDQTYLQYDNKYIELYESGKNTLNKIYDIQYCNLNYYRNKICSIVLNYKTIEIQDIEDINNNIRLIYNEIAPLCSHDFINNITSELICILTNIITQKASDSIALEFIKNWYNEIQQMDFQYKDYSFGIAHMIELIAKLSLNCRNLSEFFNAIRMLTNYINNALKDIPTLYRGLNYFDKTNHIMFINLIRWCLKLANIPVCKNHKLCIFTNLSLEDYGYAMSDTRKLVAKLYGKTLHTGADKYFETENNWFSTKNEGYNILNKLEV